MMPAYHRLHRNLAPLLGPGVKAPKLPGPFFLLVARRLREARSHFHFSNRPFRVKHFQTIHRYCVDTARELVLLFGIGTKALPSWDSKTRRNNLCRGLAVRRTAGPSGSAN